MGKYSAVLLPAEEITDPDVEPNSKWIPEIDEDLSEEFYPQEIQSTKAEKKDKKKKKAKNVTNKRKSVEVASEDSEEEETITMETAD